MRLRFPVLVVCLLFAGASLLPAQGDATYRQPSPALAAIVEAPLTPLVSLSPDRKNLLLLERPSLPPVAELAEPELRLAGLRINPATNGPSRETYYTGLVVKPLAGGAEQRIAGFPAGARLTSLAWSRDSRHLAVTVTLPSRLELWLVELASARARRLTDRALNGVMDTPTWVDDATLVVSLLPAGRGPAPAAPTVPSGPVVQENLTGKRPARTYADMLASAHNEALFEHYATAELALVGTDGKNSPLGLRGLIGNALPSPDGRLLLVTTWSRPYSYLVPVSRFPTKITIHDRAGKLVHTAADLPLAESIPIPTGSVRTGPRSVTWRADTPATLSWMQALDGGDAGREAALRDEWFTHAAPFTGAPVSQQKFALRAGAVTWGDDQRAIVSESWTKTRKIRTWLVAPGSPGVAPTLLFDRSSEDRYNAPGTPVLARNAFGRAVLFMSADKSKFYYDGAGASPEGDRPFLDELDLATKQTRRLWRSTAPHYETFVAHLDPAFTRIVTSRESVTEPANYFIRTLGVADDAQALAPITRFPNPFPQFAAVKKEVITYKRADGVALSGTLYLPPGRTALDGPLPTLLWAYPREFKDADAAGQVKESPYRFIRVSPLGPLPFVLAGYAVLDDPTMPIIGAGKTEPNDTYVPQLVASAKAANDELVRRGVTDPKRVAVAGHSYGAFMTANLLAHSDLFAAGIARSGAYNRTLTPFGFQAEERTFWQAPEVYAAMSPFNHANKIKSPLLLVHGAVDNNPGTFPIQSERFYNALKGHGATTRYIQLPHESHGYRGRENVLHLLWETEKWLDTYVKPAAKDGKK
ncbi:MAG: prolyl oligopeptidase family serine peptidase [Opitutaceae bacterium]|nr:prolyl oligopeptidase family serine peptidase [Opitutaceae bacterium]